MSFVGRQRHPASLNLFVRAVITRSGLIGRGFAVLALLSISRYRCFDRRGNYFRRRSNSNLENDANFFLRSYSDVSSIYRSRVAFLPRTGVGRRLPVRILSCVPFWSLLMTLTIGSSDRGAASSVRQGASR